jgi:uncharacterized protein (TIGR03437 family)
MLCRTSVFLLCAAIPAVLAAQVSVLTANYDNSRTNANLNERALNTVNVNSRQFGKLYSFPVDGEVYTQPLYVAGVKVPGKGTRNVLYVATMHNTVFAFDADATLGTAALWSTNFGPAVNPHDFDLINFSYTDILNEVGILGTPVIDPSSGTLYAVNETFTTQGATKVHAHYLHALDITTGAEKFGGPVLLNATVPGTGWGGLDQTPNQQLAFSSDNHLQRPALLLVNGSVYVAFGSHGDLAPWHGWILGYDATTLQQTAAWNTTPSAAASAIWQGGRGLAADDAGSIYCATGNGNFNGATQWGMSALRLTPGGNTLTVADYFTPSLWQPLSGNDIDLGSNGPVLIPGTNLMYAAGKEGVVFLLDQTNMGHEVPTDSQIVQSFQAADPSITVITGETSGFYIFNSALWNRTDGPIAYFWPSVGSATPPPLTSYRMSGGKFVTTPFSTNSIATNRAPFAGMTISANGDDQGSGILWATSAASGTLPAAGTLHAFDALNLNNELWNSSQVPARDAYGNFVKFANPTVANGKVFVPTASGEVFAYGLLPGITGVLNVVSAASYAGGPVAPGELISIFGNTVAPLPPNSSPLSPVNGYFPTSLEGVQVTFNSQPAALLYGSSGQINAIVPFSATGESSVNMYVGTSSGHGFTVSLPVAAAAPAIFSQDTSGSGAGAILKNADYSLVTPSHPAALGSVVAIFATGAGLTNPVSKDGQLTGGGTLPVVAASVAVTIGGQPAKVLYQGAAPGLVAGVTQINVQVPLNITPGEAVPVTLSVGGIAAQNTVTLAVQ